MMVTFVSQCEKKALARTRRVLDSFANRIGDNTWQTVITEDGLKTIKKMLRKTATKNTAVSCHWVRSRRRSQFLWVVGNKQKFDSQGWVAVNRTKRNWLKSEYENTWQYLPLIKALTALAALLHDWGKATLLFQEKLEPNSPNKLKGDPIRHEWISCLLLKSLVVASEKNTQDSWLNSLAKGELDEAYLRDQLADIAEKPLIELPPAAQLLAWLILSHHRLPVAEQPKNFRSGNVESLDDLFKLLQKSWGYENRYDEAAYLERVAQCFQFSDGLLTDSKPWLSQIKKWAVKLQTNQSLLDQSIHDGSYRVVLHHARLCLMLGDHQYSSQDADPKWQSDMLLYANTYRGGQKKRKQLHYKQKLDEHLVGVAKCGLQLAHLLPAFEQELPRTEDFSALRKAATGNYAWQEKAVKQISVYTKNLDGITFGFFAVNMASTGKGKTFANAKIMRALSEDGSSLRYVLALGLRTLTLQTGQEYRERIGLDDSELAVLIGSRAVLELNQFTQQENKEPDEESSGSESLESLLDEDIDFNCPIPEGILATQLTSEKMRKFLYAPVLACTIDHMMAATETVRGGRYILPSLRLMSSDLVIDEIDDFTGDDNIAIGRLIHLAGMLGRKVVISSATIPPDMAEGYFHVYQQGWALFCKARGIKTHLGSAWVDEFNTQTQSISDTEGYRTAHRAFINKRVEKLKDEEAKRKADIQYCHSEREQFENNLDDDVTEQKQRSYFNLIMSNIETKHALNATVDDGTGLNISFGVIRTANIGPCIALARHLSEAKFSEDTDVRFMCYHSRQTLLLRHYQEQHLDAVLKRKEKKGEQPKAFFNTVIRQHINTVHKQGPEKRNLIFIVVASPVVEVGRDHDYDWAIIEPSSYRSIIQMAGRVRRHRIGEAPGLNVTLMQYNWKGFSNTNSQNTKVFNQPGYENLFGLRHKNLDALLEEAAIANRLDATPRVQKPDYMYQKNFKLSNRLNGLAELEHADTWRLLANYQQTGPHSLQGYVQSCWWLTGLPQKLAEFRAGRQSLKTLLVWDEREENYQFCEQNKEGQLIPRTEVLGIQIAPCEAKLNNRYWLHRDYDECVTKLAEEQGMSKRLVSIKYGELSFPWQEGASYDYSDQFGLEKKQR